MGAKAFLAMSARESPEEWYVQDFCQDSDSEVGVLQSEHADGEAFRIHKMHATEKVQALEVALAQQSEKVAAESHRLEVSEKERRDLCDLVFVLNEQIAALQKTAQPTRNIKTSQEKSHEQPCLEARDALRIAISAIPTPSRSTCRSVCAPSPAHQDSHASRIDASPIHKMQTTSLRAKKRQCRANQSKLDLQARHLVALEKERDELWSRFSSLNRKIAAMREERHLQHRALHDLQC